MQYHVKLKSIIHALGDAGRPILQHVLLRNDGVIATNGFMVAYLKNPADQTGMIDASEIVEVEHEEIAIDGTGFVSLLHDVETGIDSHVYVKAIHDDSVKFQYYSKTSKTFEERVLHRKTDEGFPAVMDFLQTGRSAAKQKVAYTHLDLKMVDKVSKIIKPFVDSKKNLPAVLVFNGEEAPIYISSMDGNEYELILMPMRLDKELHSKYGIKGVENK